MTDSQAAGGHLSQMMYKRRSILGGLDSIKSGSANCDLSSCQVRTLLLWTYRTITSPPNTIYTFPLEPLNRGSRHCDGTVPSARAVSPVTTIGSGLRGRESRDMAVKRGGLAFQVDGGSCQLSIGLSSPDVKHAHVLTRLKAPKMAGSRPYTSIGRSSACPIRRNERVDSLSVSRAVYHR